MVTFNNLHISIATTFEIYLAIWIKVFCKSVLYLKNISQPCGHSEGQFWPKLHHGQVGGQGGGQILICLFNFLKHLQNLIQMTLDRPLAGLVLSPVELTHGYHFLAKQQVQYPPPAGNPFMTSHSPVQAGWAHVVWYDFLM